MKINMNKDLALAAGVGVIIGLLALSYASNNNLNRLGNIPVDSPLYALAQDLTPGFGGDGVINKGIANSLASKLLDTQKKINEGETDDAVEKLNDIIREVSAQKGKKITERTADALITAANAAIAEIQNPSEGNDDGGATVCTGTVMSDGTCCQSPNIVKWDTVLNTWVCGSAV